MAPPRLRTLERKQQQRQARKLRRKAKLLHSTSMPQARPGLACLPPNAKPWQSALRA